MSSHFDMDALDRALRDPTMTQELIDALIADPELLRKALTRLAEDPKLVPELPIQLQQFLASVLAGS